MTVEEGKGGTCQFRLMIWNCLKDGLHACSLAHSILGHGGAAFSLLVCSDVWVGQFVVIANQELPPNQDL